MPDSPTAPREHEFTGPFGACAGCGKYVEELIDERYCRGRIHKRNLPSPGCSAQVSRDETTLYWASVTCPTCLAMMPPDTGGRSSIKHSYTGEGNNFVD